jgi:hypothetical protein
LWTGLNRPPGRPAFHAGLPASGPVSHCYPFSGSVALALECDDRDRPGAGGAGYHPSRAVVMAACDVYDVYMIRKQLYISDEHERALKTRASELGVSEAELVRRLLDGLLLGEGGGSGLAKAGAAEALEDFLREADRLAESHRFPEGYQFDREELYEDRA